ncbi:MAG: hypothetical protein ACRDBY_11115 [Cetobacterium sp.]
MTHDECVRLYRQTHDEYYLNILLNKDYKYINKVASRIYQKYKSRYEFTDVLHEVILCYISIVKDKFKLDNNKAKFFTYVHKALPLNSLIFVRDDKYYPGQRDNRIKTNVDVQPLCSDSYDTPVESEICIMKTMIDKYIKENCDEIESSIMNKMLYEDLTQTAIANELEIKKNYVSKTIKKHIIEIKKIIN